MSVGKDGSTAGQLSRRRWNLGAIAGLAVAAVGILLSVVQSKASTRNCSAAGPRVDCGYVGIGKAECEGKGCCWMPMGAAVPHIDLPWCIFPNNGKSSYSVDSVSATDDGLEAALSIGDATSPELGADVAKLSLRVVHVAKDILRVTLRPAEGKPRWEIPQHLFSGEIWDSGGIEGGGDSLEYLYDVGSKSFGLSVSRKGDSTPLFDSRDFRLLYKEQYMEITTAVPPDSSMYGLGERTASGGLRLPRDGRTVALWARDYPSAHPDENLYGSFPHVMEVRPDGSTHGILLLNSNGMDAVLSPGALSFRLIGGVLDFFFFVGPTPAAVSEQLTRVVGRPALPPQWALGFHQCKWGYRTVQEVRDVVDTYAAKGIPLDVMWTDIDYMDGFRVFTLNPTKFALADMRGFIEMLHSRNQHWVPIVDPGVKVDKGYSVYEEGLRRDVFIKDVRGEPLVGMVWPGAVHFPDFLNPENNKYWAEQISEFHKMVPFDGLWIDMNEASNFCDGVACEAPEHDPDARLRERSLTPTSAAALVVCSLRCYANVSITPHNLAEDTVRAMQGLETPPYAISNANHRMPLSSHTIPVSASHYDGTLEYDAHSIYGLSEAVATHAALLELQPGKRPFILTRSSFPGTGAVAAHWTGDNAATWDDLRWSISSVLASGLAGISFVGADICGFQQNTTEELCGRWISAGAFYPFVRDHSDLDSGYQELYRWDSVADAGRRALAMRYRLMPYLYSAFAASTRDGVPVARPLFFEFPEDAEAQGAHLQWLLGDSLLISPVLYEGATSVEPYFPQGLWYSLWDHSVVDTRTGGKSVTLDASPGHVPIHIRGGSVIPLQESGMTVAAVRETPLTLRVALPILASTPGFLGGRCGEATEKLLGHVSHGGMSATACGELYFDDGVSIQGPGTSHTLHVAATLDCPAGSTTCSGRLLLNFIDPLSLSSISDVGSCGPDATLPILDMIEILGLDAKPQRVSQWQGLGQRRELADGHVTWHADTQRAAVTHLQVQLSCPHELHLAWEVDVGSRSES